MQSPAPSRHGVALATVAIAALLLVLWQLASPAVPSALRPPAQQQRAPACSPQERAAQVALLDKGLSPCPGHAWWEAMVETGELSCRPLTLLNVGANKGYTLSYFAALLQPSAGITSARVHDNLVQHYGASLPYPCGACGDCHEAPPAALAPRVCPGPPPTLPQAHALNLLGFEPLMDNIEVLYYGLDVLFRARQGALQGNLRVAVHHAAVVGAAGVGSVAFSVCGRGEELCGVEASGKSTSGSGGSVVQVPATTVDEAAARFGVPPVDVLIIDAEGMDPEVLDGAAGMLAAGRVRVLQFEYHSLRAWASRSLREVVAQLGGWGYVCYLQQRELLLELGGSCWAEEYEFKSWANVLCVARHEAALLAAAHMFTPRALGLGGGVGGAPAAA